MDDQIQKADSLVDNPGQCDCCDFETQDLIRYEHRCIQSNTIEVLYFCRLCWNSDACAMRLYPTKEFDARDVLIRICRMFNMICDENLRDIERKIKGEE